METRGIGILDCEEGRHCQTPCKGARLAFDKIPIPRVLVQHARWGTHGKMSLSKRPLASTVPGWREWNDVPTVRQPRLRFTRMIILAAKSSLLRCYANVKDRLGSPINQIMLHVTVCRWDRFNFNREGRGGGENERLSPSRTREQGVFIASETVLVSPTASLFNALDRFDGSVDDKMLRRDESRHFLHSSRPTSIQYIL